jgi:hypothetical protein
MECFLIAKLQGHGSNTISTGIGETIGRFGSSGKALSSVSLLFMILSEHPE